MEQKRWGSLVFQPLFAPGTAWYRVVEYLFYPCDSEAGFDPATGWDLLQSGSTTPLPRTSLRIRGAKKKVETNQEQAWPYGGAVMTKQTRVRAAAEDFVRTLEECGSSRADAASELAAIAVSLASEGNTDRATILMEISDYLRELESEGSRGSDIPLDDAEPPSD
jgi:hypothetical protein